MKIAMVSTLMPETHYARYLLNALVKDFRNIEWFVYTNKNEYIKPLDSDLTLCQCWSKNILYPIQIIKKIIRDKINIVHLQHEFNMYGRAITAILFPLFILLLRTVGKKVVVTVHAVVPKKEVNLSFLETFSWPRSKIVLIFTKIGLFLIYKLIGIFSNAIIVHTNQAKMILASDYRVYMRKIYVIPHGVPKRDTSKPVEEKGWLFDKIRNKKIILYFGYIVKRKGLEYLIEAFEQIAENYQDYMLVIAGGTLPGHEEYVARLKEIVKLKNLKDRIIFTGFITENILEALFVLSKFVVLPAVYSISASGPLAQAISFHKPVISNNVGVMREEITPRINGLLCPSKDVQTLKNAMTNLIEDPGLLEKLSRNMEKKAKEREWSKIARDTYKIYTNLV